MTTTATRKVKNRIMNAINDESGVDYLEVQSYSASGGLRISGIVCGRDASTENAVEGETLAAVDTEAGETFSVFWGEGEEGGGWNVTTPVDEELSISEAVDRAAEIVKE